jgi:hypothetical protein
MVTNNMLLTMSWHHFFLKANDKKQDIHVDSHKIFQ